MSYLEEKFLLHVRAAGLPEPVREVPVIAGLGHRFDLVWPDKSLAVDLQGATWQAGRHSRGGGYEIDCFKANIAGLAGWKVLRFTAGQVDSGEALAMLEVALGRRELQPLIDRRMAETAARRSAGARAGWALKKQRQQEEQGPTKG